MKRTAAIAAFAVSLALLPSCSPEPDNTPTPTPVVTTTTADTPTPTESPTTEPPEPSPTQSETLDADQTEAFDTLNEFFRLLNALRKDPEMSVQPLADITTGQTQINEINGISHYRELNAVQVGDTSWTVLEVGAPFDRDGARAVPVTVCTDSTEVDIVDAETGSSILPADRAYFVLWQIEVTSENEGYWNVGDLTSGKVEQCPAQ